MLTPEDIRSVAYHAINYVEQEDYRSYDNFDALTSPFLFWLSRRNPMLQRVLIQINARTPLSLRWMGVRKLRHTKALSDMLLIYCRMMPDKVDPLLWARCERMAALLLNQALRTEGSITWGLNMPYATRFVAADGTMPNLYTTACAGHGLLAWFRLSRNNEVAQTLRSVSHGIIRQIGAARTNSGQRFLKYYPGDTNPVPNVNALALHLLAEINVILEEEVTDQPFLEEILDYLVSAQNPDGSWYYSEGKKGKWMDGFHTGFILDSLIGYAEIYKKHDLNAPIRKGFDFFLQNFISPEFTPYYHPRQFRMLDSQNNAQILQTIVTGATFFKEDRSEMLNGLLQYILKNMFNPGGWFYFQKKRFQTIKTPYFRWSQTPMILAMLLVADYLKNQGHE